MEFLFQHLDALFKLRHLFVLLPELRGLPFDHCGLITHQQPQRLDERLLSLKPEERFDATLDTEVHLRTR